MDTKKPVENETKDDVPSTSAAMSKTTTISTIAVQSGKTRIVIALLHCGDWLSLKILEITPELTKLGATLEEALELQRAHDEVLRQLQNKQSPVEELLRQADQLIATQKPRAEVYAAMAESLGRAWRDINSTLELRKVILDLNVQYHQKAKEFFEKMSALESSCSDTVIPIEIEAVKNFLTVIHDLRRALLESLMGALQAGNLLLAKLKELGAEGTLDSRPDRIRSSVNRAISQVQSWLDELHVKRQILEVTFTRRKTQLEQCLALAILAADLKDLEDTMHDRRNILANSNQLGDSSSSAELLLHEHKKLLPEAKLLQERALKITKATEQLVASGCFAGEEATGQAYVILSSTSDYLTDLQSRESLLERVIAFFRSSQTVLTKLAQLEIQLKTTDLPSTSPKLAQLHAQCAKTIEEATAAPITEGYAILDLAGQRQARADGVKKMVEELENKKILLDSLCTAHREENIKINTALNNFLDQHNEIYTWLVTIAEAFLQGHQDMGTDLPMAQDFLELHKQLLTDLQTKGNEINALLLTLPPIMEYLDDRERRDVDSKVEAIHDRWMKLKNNLENRLDLAKIYVKFHTEANTVNKEMDNLENILRHNKDNIDDETMRIIEEKFETLVPLYQSAKNTGLTFISEAKMATQPHLDTRRACLCVESVLERLASRQLTVTRNWQTFCEDVVEKRELIVRLERTMAESTQTINWVSKIDVQLYPVITTSSTRPNDVVLYLEGKLESVLPELRKAQHEVEERIKSAETLLAKAPPTDEKSVNIRNKLNELHQKLIDILSEYQILLQVIIGYFKNLEEIDKKAENYNSQLERTGYPKEMQEAESVIRQHDVIRETILERFRFAQTECEQITERINKQEPPQAAVQDVSKLQHVLELRRAEFENQWRQRHESLKSHYQICEFDNNLKQTDQNIDELGQRLKDIKGQYGDSLSDAKATAQLFRNFEKTVETLETRVQTLVTSGKTILEERHPQSPHVERELQSLQDKWNNLKKETENTRDDLDLNVKYFGIIEEADEWYREGSKLLVTIARKSNSVKQPEEAHQLLDEISSYLHPGADIQNQRIKKIVELATKVYADESKCLPIITANKDMLESFASVSKELQVLSENLIGAQKEKQRILREQEEARVAEQAKKLEEARLAEERKREEEIRLAAEQARLIEERKKLEEAQKAEQARLETERRKLEEARLAEEAKFAEHRRKAEEELRAEEARLQEERRKAEAARLEDEARRAEESRLAAERQKAEEARRKKEAQNSELKRLEEEKRKAELAELEEEQRKIEKARLDAEKAILEEERRKLQEASLAEEARLAEEKKWLEMVRLEEAKKAEITRLEEERRKTELAKLESERKAELSRLEELRKFQQAQIEDERRKLDEAKLEAIKSEEERRKAEQLRLEELRKAEHAKLEEIRRLELALIEEEKKKAKEVRLEEERKAEQARLDLQHRLEEQRKLEQAAEEARRAEDARLEEVRRAEKAKLEEEKRKARLEQERKVIEEQRKQETIQITEVTEIAKLESIQTKEEPEEPPVFTSPLSDAVIQEGSKFTFICRVYGTPVPVVTWFKSGVAIENNPDYHTTFDKTGLCTLTIEETFAEDSAKYTCAATNSSGTAETSAMLSVKETEREEQLLPPSFLKMLQHGVAKEGHTFQFECKVEGNPLPTVQWFKNSECIDNSPNYLITYNNGEAVLKFEKVKLDDTCDYTCKASNQMGTAQSTTNLLVTPLEPTEAPAFIVPLSNIMARAGQKLKLECEVSGLPPPILTWSHNGRPVKETRDLKLQFEENKAVLVINEAFPKDAGTYQVSAKNIAGQATSSCSVSVKGRLPTETSDSEMASDLEPIRPSIQLPLANTTIKEGDRVRLDCVIVGQPEPEVIWYHDGKPVKESADIQLLFQGDRCSLVIQEVLPEDGGNYKVVALNSAGEASSQCVLSVTPTEVADKTKEEKDEGKGELTGIPPRFVKLLADVLVTEGDTVTFEGNVIGEPRPEINWLLNNLPIKDPVHFVTTYDAEGNFKLEINNVRPEDKGVYTVKASNSAGDAKCFAQLIVKSFKPAETVKYEEVKSAPVFKEMFHDKIAFENTAVKFECMVTGKPKPKVKWLFNGNPISGKDFLISTSGDREVLSIPDLRKVHQGTITCVAENEAGKSSCAATLSVQTSTDIALPEVPLVVPLQTEIKQHIETSYKLNREVITQTSETSSSKITTSTSTGTEPHVEEHKFISQQAKEFRQIDQQAPDIKESQRTEEYHKVGKEPPSISEKSSSIYTIGGQSDTQINNIEQQQIFKKPVKITRPPKFIDPVMGKIIDQDVNVILQGILDGYPTPNITWTKNGEEIKQTDRIHITWVLNKASLEIKNATVADAGRYSCTAVNEGGTAVSTADLVVRKTIFPPVFGRRLQAQVIKKGERIIMEVEVTGTPEPTVTWYKDDVPIKQALKGGCKIKSMGQGHTLTMEKGDLNHTGRYMVRATNAGGEAQSIADIAVYEPTPDTMVEVVKTVVFEDIKKHEILSSSADKMSSTVIPQAVAIHPTKLIEVPKPLSPFSSSQTSQTISSKSEFSSKSEQMMSQQYKSVKLQHTMPDIPFPKPVEVKQNEFLQRQTDFELCIPPDVQQQEIIEEKKVETKDDGIETSSITKQSSLQYFVKKMKEGETVIQKEGTIPEPIKPEVYQKFSETHTEKSETQVPIKVVEKPITVPQPQTSSFSCKPVNEYRMFSQKISAPITQEYKSFSSTKEEKTEIKSEQKHDEKIYTTTTKHVTEPVQQEYRSFSSTTQHISEPVKQEFKTTTTQRNFEPQGHRYESFSSTQNVSEPIKEFQSFSSTQIIPDLQLKPEPPAEICYAPKADVSSKSEDVFGKFKKMSETYAIPEEIPKTVKILPPPPPPKPETIKPFEQKEKIKQFSEHTEKSFQTSYKTSSSSYSSTYESGTLPFTQQVYVEPTTQKLWSTKHEIFERPTSVASSAYSTERQTFSRPISAQAGLVEPSQEALQMEKRWAHKFSETHAEKSWPPPLQEEPTIQPSWSVQSTLEKKWTPISVKTEQSFKETKRVCEKTPVLVPHYIAEVSHLGSNINEQSLLDTTYSSLNSESVVEERNVRPSEIIKSWPPTAALQEYVPPQAKRYSPLDSLPIRPVSVQDITDEVYLEPGPPPEIGYAAPPTERRQSYVEQIEQELEKDLEKEPTKVPSYAVRTIPPPKYYVKEVIPPPLPPKKEFPIAPPIPAKTKKNIEVTSLPFSRFPDLEPFPFRPEPEKPKPLRVGPPPTPSKFIKGRFTDSDYESDFEAVRIPPKWKPSMSDTEEPSYRRVRAPKLVTTGRSRSQEPEPLPPSRFDQPPQFQGPPRPKINFEECRRKKDSLQIKKMTKHYEAMRREISPPTIKPASPPIYVQPDKRPESPKLKKKIVIDGYMADTDEPLTQQRILKTELIKEERSESKHFSQSSHYESTTQNLVQSKPKVTKYPVKKHHTASSTTVKKEFIATPIITSQTTQSLYETHHKDTKFEAFPYQPEPSRPKPAKVPPPPSPSKFVKGDFKETDYESDYEGRIPPIWRADHEPQYKPVRPVLTPSQQHYQVARTPTPPTEFERPPQTYGPLRPKFEPIEKIKPDFKPASKTIVCKPKPKPAAAPVTDLIVATPAVPSPVIIQPGSPPEIGYAPGPKKTQYYKSTVSAPYHNAVQTETSNVVHLDESTDTCHRTMSVQQTHKVIKFGDKYRQQEQKLEAFPYSPTPERPRRSTSVPPPPTPTKFIPRESRESDYESEVETCRIKPKWTPGGFEEDLRYRKVKAPPLHQRSSSVPAPRERVVTPMEFDQPPLMPSEISTTTTTDYVDGETRRHETSIFKKFSESKTNQLTKTSQSFEPPSRHLQPGSPPEYGYVQDQRLTKSGATKMASHHMESMTKDFKSKTQQFVQDIMNDVNTQKTQKPILKTGIDEDAQVYREESRAMQHGTKHVDPDTGLIYFKYDFGYEFGIILPGESKSGGIPVPKKTVIEPPKRTRDIEMPVYHESTTTNHNPPTPQFKPKKFTSKVANKWEPTSESEMSEYEGEYKRRGQFSQRWEPSSCSPVSLSPSLPSTSPAFNVTFAGSGRPEVQTPPSCPSTPGPTQIKVLLSGQPRAPMFITPLRDIAVVSGQAAKFECIVQSEPPPNILWSKNGRIIENSNDYQLHYRNGVCRLTISQAYPEDAGTYTCTANNCVGTSNSTATLQVPGVPSHMYGTYRQFQTGRRSVSPELYRRPESPAMIHHSVGKLNNVSYRQENHKSTTLYENNTV